ncbi:MAG: hypothetical protein HYZ14_07900 [Bacteroidetes bacterium]|nr:hypothetical protein [Bacteroidota bacterium]
MFEKAAQAGNRNKIVPGWLRALLVLPFVAGGIVLMVYMGNIYDAVADIQVSWFDRYYVIITGLITLVVYLFILLISLIPGIILTILARRFYEKKLP